LTGGSSPIRILAVDDHSLVRDGIAGLIAIQTDMTLVAQAGNGREAIQQFRTHRPDVTLMDLQMPEMNGLDALIAIRTEFPDARVIVLTTYEATRRSSARSRPARRANGSRTGSIQIRCKPSDGPRWQKESVAGGVVPARSARQR
jgi:chemotaxis response regulator CheB